MSDFFNTQKIDRLEIDAKKRQKKIQDLKNDPATRQRSALVPRDDLLNTYIDGSDSLGNKGFYVGIQHVPSGNTIKFKAFITAFNETFSSDWATETVYGRADPIMLFKATTRRISMAFKIPAASLGEAYENLDKVGKLTQYLYPNYLDLGNANTISQGPLVRLELANLLRRTDLMITPHQTDPFLAEPENGNAGESLKDLKEKGATKWSRQNGADSEKKESAGLLGAITSLSINHNLETDAGVLEVGPAGMEGKGAAALLPKLIEVNIDFMPIHEHSLGWRTVGEETYFAFDGFPYGTNMTKTITEAINEGLDPSKRASAQDKLSAKAQMQQARDNENESGFQNAAARWKMTKDAFGRRKAAMSSTIRGIKIPGSEGPAIETVGSRIDDRRDRKAAEAAAKAERERIESAVDKFIDIN